MIYRTKHCKAMYLNMLSSAVYFYGKLQINDKNLKKYLKDIINK